MSFKPVNLVQWNVSPVPPRNGLPQWWGYFTADDTIAQVEASGYFNIAPYFEIGRNTTWYVGDLLYCVCSDGVVELQIATVGNTVTTTGSSFVVPANSITNVQINAAAAIAYSKLAALPSADILVGSAGNVATATAVTGDVTISNTGVTAIGAAKVTKAMLAATVRPAAMIVFAGTPTTVGGAAAEAFAVAGAVGATDKAYVQIVDNGTANVTALQAVVTDNTLTVTFSANPGNDTIFNYQIIRATS